MPGKNCISQKNPQNLVANLNAIFERVQKESLKQRMAKYRLVGLKKISIVSQKHVTELPPNMGTSVNCSFTKVLPF